jgi:cytoskeletal protein RodZ
MRITTIARFLPLSLMSLLLAIVGCTGKPAATPDASSSASSSNSSGANSASNPSPATTPATQAPAPAPAPPPPPIVIPAGTTITVTLDQTVNSQTANNGDPFSASLAVPVTSGALVVLPVGTKVGGTIVTAQSAGKFKGNALLQLVIDSVRLKGTRYPMQTNEIEDVGKGRGKRTAIGAGGGAAFGAIVGALAGGGKGAAIGALAGGGAGTAGAAFTGKRDIVLPAETRLHFKLAQPLSVPAPDAAAPAPSTN